MKLSAAAATLSVVLFASSACFAQWPEQPYVQMQNAPDAELCVSAAKAVEALREELGQLHGKFRDPRTRAASDLRVAGLSFYPVRIRRFITVDGAGHASPMDVDYYLVDIDNDGSQDMITLVSGGYGPAGEGDILYLLKNNLAAAPQPIAKAEFANVALEIGGRTNIFRGEHGQRFDPFYFMYPFALQGKNYLLIDGNRPEPKHLVVELVPGIGIATRCSSDVG